MLSLYLTCLFSLLISCAATSDVFSENLHIRPLSTGHVYAYFEFKTLYNKKLVSLNYGELDVSKPFSQPL